MWWWIACFFTAWEAERVYAEPVCDYCGFEMPPEQLWWTREDTVICNECIE